LGPVVAIDLCGHPLLHIGVDVVDRRQPPDHRLQAGGVHQQVAGIPLNRVDLILEMLVAIATAVAAGAGQVHEYLGLQCLRG
jgi:hypothetical protein